MGLLTGGGGGLLALAVLSLPPANSSPSLQSSSLATSYPPKRLHKVSLQCEVVGVHGSSDGHVHRLARGGRACRRWLSTHSTTLTTAVDPKARI